MARASEPQKPDIEHVTPESIALRGRRPEYAFRTFDEFRAVQKRVYDDVRAPLVVDEVSEATISFYVEESGVLDRKVPLTDRERIAVNCIDEFLAFFLMASSALVKEAAPTVAFTADHLLLRNITADLAAIRLLVRAGFIAPSLKLCRPLQESVDALILAQHDRVFAQQFASSVDPKLANAVWHRFIAREKVIKSIKAKSPGYQLIAKSQFAAIAADMAPLLGASVHPSAFASLLAITHDIPFIQTGERDEQFSRPYPMLVLVAYTCWLALHFALRVVPDGSTRSIVSRMITEHDNYAERWAMALSDTFVLMVSANANQTDKGLPLGLRFQAADERLRKQHEP
jgi:hypothetical protein